MGKIKKLWLRLNDFIFVMELGYPIITPFIIGMIIVVTIMVIGVYYLPAKYADILTWITFILVLFFAVRRAFRNVAFLKALEEGRITIEDPDLTLSKIIEEIEEESKRRKR